jgi:hypothetical protein
MSPKTTKWVRRGIVTTLVLGVAALAVGSASKQRPQAAFSHTGTSVDTSTQRSIAGGATALVPAPAVPEAAPGAATDASSGLPSTPDRIERTADLTVEVKKGSFDAQWTAAFRIAQRYGGQIMSSTRGVPSPQPVPLEQNGAASNASAKQPAIGDITIRIPAQNFVNASNALRALGTVRGDNTTTQDVGQEYVDLQSRLRNLRAEENTLLALFKRTTTIKDTLAVQAQVSNVEGQIEQITGRIKYLDANTLFSTITVHLQEPGVTVIPTVNQGPSLGGAWDTAKTGLVRLAGAGLILGLWLLPFGALGLIGMTIWRRARGPAHQV